MKGFVSIRCLVRSNRSDVAATSHQPIVTESCTVHTAHYCTPVHLYSTVHWTLIALRQDLVPLLPLPDHYKQATATANKCGYLH